MDDRDDTKGKIRYDFSAEMWRHDSEGGWHFVSLPKAMSNEIRQGLKWQEEGWGRMKTMAEIASHRWETAIWFDKKRGTYLLPLKAGIRKKLGLEVGEEVKVRLFI